MIAGENCLKANGKVIKLIDLIENTSTTNIINKILNR
jgi:bifunctional ADP-heptose synthase (sugar kinase/adenylyltransferase)